MRRAIVTALALSLARGAGAQLVERPAATPTPLRQVAREASLQSSIERDVAPLQAAPPQVIVAPRWRILVVFAPTLPLFASDARFGQALTPCRGELPPGAEVPAFAAANSPWAAFDSAATGQPLVVFSIAPNGGPGATCGDTLVDQTTAVARGLEFLSPAYHADQNPVSVGLRRGDVQLRPVYLGRARVLRVRGAMTGRDSTQQLRLYVPLEDLAPDSSGRFTPARLRIVTAGTRQDTVEIPERVLRQVWLQALPWRVDRLGPAGVPGGEGSVIRSALTGSSSPNAQTRRDSRVALGTALWSGGDSLASAVVLGQVLESDPCLASSPNADPMVRSALTRMRSIQYCTTRSPIGVLARGIVFPGLGQQTSGRRGKAIALGTVAVLGLSGAAALQSRRVYSDYQAATTTDAASQLYDSASNYRMMATGIAWTGVAVWIGSAVEAAWKQSRRNSNVNAVSSYGGAR